MGSDRPSLTFCVGHGMAINVLPFTKMPIGISVLRCVRRNYDFGGLFHASFINFFVPFKFHSDSRDNGGKPQKHSTTT